MKSIAKSGILALAAAALLLSAVSCGYWFEFDIKVKNEASYPIACLVACEYGAGFSYPDTTLPQSLLRGYSFYLDIAPDTTCSVYYYHTLAKNGRSLFEYFFHKDVPQGVLSLYFFKQSDIDTLSWAEICSQDKCLGRYDFVYRPESYMDPDYGVYTIPFLPPEDEDELHTRLGAIKSFQ